jgi:predicted nucleic acid-binding protein
MSRIYFDTNILAYLSEYPSTFGPVAEAFLARCLRAKQQIVTSDLAVAEWIYGVFKQGRPDIAEAYRLTVADGSQFRRLPVTSAAFDLAPRIGPGFGLKLLDALHLATAIEAGCAGFVTNDRAFDKVTAITIINPFERT